MDIQRREPINFAAGDTLLFQRHLVEFYARDGWSLTYEIFESAGQPVTTFASTTATDGSSDHYVNIPNFLQYNQPGEYILAGYAKNANTGERHQIYRGELIVTENLDLGVAVDDQTSFEEQMVVLLRAKCLRLAQNELIETDVNRVKIVREERTKARTELNFWEERWNWYRKQQAVANGRPNPNMIMPAFNIM
jgi:hypothetical protein